MAERVGLATSVSSCGTPGRAAAGVVGFVGEAIGAVEVGVWCVAEGAVCVEGQCAAAWSSDEHGGDGGTIDVAVVAEHAGGSHGERRVLVGAVAVVGRDWGVVDGS